MTDAAGGVAFDIMGRGTPLQIAWTAHGDDDAWLALDRNGNGIIDNGLELFGSVAQQPSPPPGELPNGYRALAAFDTAPQGGNGDGIIDQRDAVFVSLRLWRDANHNGLSEAGELMPLVTMGVGGIDLGYKEKKTLDVHGNEFRYRARIWDLQGRQNKWAWDVYLVSSEEEAVLISDNSRAW